MDLKLAVESMTRQARAIEALTQSIPTEQGRWKPSPEEWSILEVLCHLADEEREDFRARVGWALNGGVDAWQPIDPQGWVTSRGYNQRELPSVLADFLAEREASLAWLGGLDAPDWTQEYPAPWGTIRAGDFLAAWVAHDLLHLRQLTELHYAWAAAQSAPFSLQYAGEW